MFATSLGATIRDMEYHGCMGKIHRVQSSLLVAARNTVVQKFLEESNSPWLWFVDSDMVFDRRHPMKLWETASEYDVKMVSGLAFIFKDQQQTRVVATGLASSLIHREVFEAMQPARHGSYRWFDLLLDITNNEGVSGEDTQFFIRARELGFDLMINPDAETWHIKEIGIGRVDFDRYWELQGLTA
jgi:hypothetical protein